MSDMMMEKTYIRHGKGSLHQGGLIGQTVRPDQVKKSCITYHSFSEVKGSIDRFLLVNKSSTKKHKEEMSHRLRVDKADRDTLAAALQTCLHPLHPGTHSEKLHVVNIYTGTHRQNIF